MTDNDSTPTSISGRKEPDKISCTAWYVPLAPLVDPSDLISVGLAKSDAEGRSRGVQAAKRGRSDVSTTRMSSGEGRTKHLVVSWCRVDGWLMIRSYEGEGEGDLLGLGQGG